jgi:hypothetical protein
VTQTRSWAEMLAWIEQRLVAATGDDVATWSARVRETGLTTEAEVRDWPVGSCRPAASATATAPSGSA